jgi:hypothetical protein
MAVLLFGLLQLSGQSMPSGVFEVGANLTDFG